MANNHKRKKKRILTSNNIPGRNNKPEEIVICSDIEQLTFANFIKCQINNDISVLVISGKPTPQQVFFAWITILSAHYTLINDKDQLKYLKMAGKMEALNLKITVVKALCEALTTYYNEKLVKCLSNPTDKGGWGYKLSYSKETLLQDIAMTLRLLSNEEFILIKMKLDYDKEHKKKKKDGEAPSKNAYMKMLYAIESHNKMTYDPATLTLYKFDMLYNQLKEYGDMIKEHADSMRKDTYRGKK